MLLKLFIFAFFSLNLWARTDPASLMVSPGNNSFFEIRDQARELNFVMKRPDPRLRYKLEILLNEREVVNNFIDKDRFMIRVGRYDYEVKWRLQGFDREGRLVLPNEFATVSVYYSDDPRRITLQADRHSLKDKLILSWEEQEECEAYDIIYNGKKIAKTKKFGAVLNEHADRVAIKVACADDHSHFGVVELSPKKVLANSFYYELQLGSFALDLEAQGDTFKESHIMQFHGAAWQLNWDKRRRNDLTTIFRIGRPLDFGDDLKTLGLEARLRFDLGRDVRQKLLFEYEWQSLDYEVEGGFRASQRVSFLSGGVETYFRFLHSAVKSAFLLRRELSDGGLASGAKMRLSLPQTRRLSWTAEVDYVRFDGQVEVESQEANSESRFTQIKAGFTYLL